MSDRRGARLGEVETSKCALVISLPCDWPINISPNKAKCVFTTDSGLVDLATSDRAKLLFQNNQCHYLISLFLFLIVVIKEPDGQIYCGGGTLAVI